MKFKVGDKVKIRKDLKAGQEYGNLVMLYGYMFDETVGKELTIRQITENGNYRFYETDYVLSKEMIDKKMQQEFTKENLQNGDILETNGEGFYIYLKNDSEINLISKNGGWMPLSKYSDKLILDSDNSFTIKRVYRFNHMVDLINYIKDLESIALSRLIWERKEILDITEKNYLSNVISPFKDRVKSIVKRSLSTREFISIEVGGCEIIDFPYFEEGTMYRKMKCNRHYSLEELGL